MFPTINLPRKKILVPWADSPLAGYIRDDNTQLFDVVMSPYSFPFYTVICDPTLNDVAEIMTGPNTGVKGLRVYIGPTDPISDIPVVQQFGHHQVHEGEMHQYTYPPTALALNNSVHIRFVANNLAPTIRTPHPVLEVDSTGETWIYLYEAPTFSANGVQQNVYNRNRNTAAIAPSSTVWLGPTVTNSGTFLSAWIQGSGNQIGGGTRDSIEWDLAAGVTYLYTITSKASSNDVCIRLIWYEDLGV